MDVGETIGEAQRLLASGHEARAVELLDRAIHATSDPEQLRQIHQVAVEVHGRAAGFGKIEWHKLVVESEPHAAPSEHAVT